MPLKQPLQLLSSKGDTLQPAEQDSTDKQSYRTAEQTDNGETSSSQQESIHSMTTDEWQKQYESDGCVDLWVEEEFNSGSRLMVSLHKALACSLH